LIRVLVPGHRRAGSEVRYVIQRLDLSGWLMKLLQHALLGLLCGVVGVSKCAAQSPAQQSTSSVEGRVLHDPGGEPIRKVVVRLLPSNLDSRVYTSFAG